MSPWVVAYLLLAPLVLGTCLGVIVDAALSLRALRRDSAAEEA